MTFYLSVRIFSDSKMTKSVNNRDFYLDIAQQDSFLNKIKNGELFDWMEEELTSKNIHFNEAWILILEFDLASKTWIPVDFIHFKR